jgi:hypothetical protein
MYKKLTHSFLEDIGGIHCKVDAPYVSYETMCYKKSAFLAKNRLLFFEIVKKRFWGLVFKCVF